MFLIIFSRFRIFKKIYIKSETWVDGRHFGFFESGYHDNKIDFIDYQMR